VPSPFFASWSHILLPSLIWFVAWTVWILPNWDCIFLDRSCRYSYPPFSLFLLALRPFRSVLYSFRLVLCPSGFALYASKLPLHLFQIRLLSFKNCLYFSRPPSYLLWLPFILLGRLCFL
jgi:hypothetical protein